MLTRKQFDTTIRMLSMQDPTTSQHHCRVEICVGDDWRIMTDSCLLESNIPAVHQALADLLFVYVSENFPDATPDKCRKLGPPAPGQLDAGMKVW